MAPYGHAERTIMNIPDFGALLFILFVIVAAIRWAYRAMYWSEARLRKADRQFIENPPD
jgi:hypothetical protein